MAVAMLGLGLEASVRGERLNIPGFIDKAGALQRSVVVQRLFFFTVCDVRWQAGALCAVRTWRAQA